MAIVRLLAKTTPTTGAKSVESVALIAAKAYDYGNSLLRSINKMNDKQISILLNEIKDDKKMLYNYILNYVTFIFGIEEVSFGGVIDIENINSIHNGQISCVSRGSNIILSSNAKNLLNFFEEACCSKKGYEINDIANQMLNICLAEAPNLFKDAGAPCTFGKCDKENSCGQKNNPKIKQIIKTY